MATPNKTYAQQVQDLKNEKIQLEGQLEAAQEQIGFIAELQRENENLREQVANYSDDSRRSNVGENAKLVDAQQVAEQSANQVKVLSQQLKAEKQTNAQLEQRLAELDNASDIANYQSRSTPTQSNLLLGGMTGRLANSHCRDTAIASNCGITNTFHCGRRSVPDLPPAHD